MPNNTIESESSKELNGYNASRSVVHGVSWAILMRWAIRLVGLFSTLILARLLSPDDFGVVAMAMMIVGLLLEISEFGTASHLIRVTEIDRAHCDTAWSVTILQGTFVGLMLIALAHPAASYFNEPRIADIIYVLAFASFVGGFENVGPILIRRQMDFSRDFRFNVFKKLLVLVTTVGSALYLRSYWALVVGHLTGTFAGVALSYGIHSYRPKWSLARAQEYLHFAKSMIPLRIGSTLLLATPNFLVAGLNNTATMGSFRIASDLSATFTQEIVLPMGRGLLPNYVHLAKRPDELAKTFRQVLGVVALICMPIGAGVSSIAPDLVLVLLGPQWGFSADLMRFLAISAAIYAISLTMNNQILVATGREKTAAMLAWIRLMITAPILWLGLHYGGALGLAKATIVAPLVCLPFIYNETRQAVQLPLAALLGLLWRPFLATCVMYVGVKVLHPAQLDWPALRLALDIAVGATIFCLSTVALWMIGGRPSGAEELTLGALLKVMNRARGARAKTTTP